MFALAQTATDGRFSIFATKDDRTGTNGHGWPLRDLCDQDDRNGTDPIAHAAQFRHHPFMAGTSERWGAWWRGSRGVEAPVAVWTFRVERQRGAVGRLHDSLEEKLLGQVPEAALRALQVALDELLTNVIMHAEQAAGPVEVEVARASDALDARISYLADEFDPTSWCPPQRGTSVATARVGGLGIELVRLLMDEFRHEYADGCNVLTLRKRC